VSPYRPEGRTALREIRWGGICGVAGAIAGVGLPVGYLLAVTYGPSSLGLSSAPFWQVEGTLLLAGSILFAVSLFLYRRAFSTLSDIDRRFVAPNLLGWVGIAGFVALAVAAVLLTGSASFLSTCVQGTPTKASHCLESGPPGAVWGAYAGAVGLLGAWLGGLGVTLGLYEEGRRTGRTALTAAGLLYGILLLVLVGPILAIVDPFGGSSEILLAAPVLLLLAPSVAIGGAWR
jgi:hypothetical protein